MQNWFFDMTDSIRYYAISMDISVYNGIIWKFLKDTLQKQKICCASCTIYLMDNGGNYTLIPDEKLAKTWIGRNGFWQIRQNGFFFFIILQNEHLFLKCGQRERKPGRGEKIRAAVIY